MTHALNARDFSRALAALIVLFLIGGPATGSESQKATIHNVEIGMSSTALERQAGRPLKTIVNQKAPFGQWIYGWGSVYFAQSGLTDEVRGLPIRVPLGTRNLLIYKGMPRKKLDVSLAEWRRTDMTDVDVHYQMGRQMVQVRLDKTKRVEAGRLVSRPLLK